MKIVFFGTPQIAADALKYLLDQKMDVVAVVTKPDKPKGRSGNPLPTPVKQVVESYSPNIPVHQPPLVSDPTFAPLLEAYEADLFVVVAYGEILKQHLLDMPKLGCINLHASLLPKYRGAAPIQRCIIEGEKESGATIMYMVRKMDAGDMIKKVLIPIGPNMTAGELELEMGKQGSHALVEVIHEFSKGKVAGEPQIESEATLAPKVELEDCEINWSWPAQKIHNWVRGVNPEPGAWCWVDIKGQKKRLKIFRTLCIESMGGLPGTIHLQKKGDPLVACGSGAIQLLEVQLEGKKAMPAAELLRGLNEMKFLDLTR